MKTLPHPAPPVKPKDLPCSLTMTIGDTAYAVEPVPAGFGETKAFRLSKEDGQVYDVVRTDFGLVECDCPKYQYRIRGNSCDLCKHGLALVSSGLLDAPSPVLPQVAIPGPDDDRTYETPPPAREPASGAHRTSSGVLTDEDICRAALIG